MSPKPPIHTAGDADLWQSLIDRGLSETEATRHVLLRRRAAFMNLPETKARDYLKDVDPGALASFGLGAADMMSFGLGDQIARKLEPEAVLTQAAARQEHPTAHFVGEAVGLLAPILGEAGLARAGVKVAPTAIGAAVRGIANPAARAAAKTALNAAIGAGYAGAQAAGHTEGGLSPRLAAAKRAAPYGAVAGTILPWALATGAAGASRLRGIMNRVAGPAAEVTAPSAGAAHAAARAAMPTGLLATPEEAAVAKALGLPIDAVRGRVGAPAMAGFARPAPEPMDVPTFMRRPQTPIENAGLLAPTPQSAPMVAGNAAIPGQPNLGLLAPAGEYQTAGSSLRTASPSAPMAGPVGSLQQIALQVRLARAMGMTEAQIAHRLASLGITPQQVQAALR